MKLMQWIRRKHRLAACCLLLSLMPLAGGCYGRFPLTKAIYRFNGDVSDNKFITQILFWVFAILPVYDLAILGDAIILNLIEFWTGETLDIGQTTDPYGRTLAWSPGLNPDVGTLKVMDDGVTIESYRLVRVSPTVSLIQSDDGQLISRIVYSEQGELLWYDAQGNLQRTLSAESIQTMKNLPIL